MRGWMIGAAVLVLLSLSADTVFWAITAHSMRESFAHWVADMRQKDWRVTYAAPIRGGWPLRATFTIPDLSITGGQRALPGGVAWHADRLTLDIELARPRRLWVSAAGRETLKISHAPEIVFEAEHMQGWVRLGTRRPNRIELSAIGLSGGLAGSMHPQDVRIGTLNFGLELPAPQAGHTEERVAVEALSIGLPDNGRWPLGATIAQFKTSLYIESPQVVGKTPSEQGRAWRDGGGRGDLETLTLRWGPLAVDGHAIVRLDDRLQPAGAGQLHLAGTAAALDALAGGGVLPQGLSGTAKAVLGLSGDSPLDLPFEVQNNTLSVGKIPLTHLADIVWPRG